MRLCISLCLCAVFSLSASKPQDVFNMYNMDDASSILQAAFSHAGMHDSIHFAQPTRKPSIFSAARLRNLKLPSFGRRKVTPMPMLVPIMGTLPKPLKIDGEENQQQQQQQLLSHLQNGHFLTAPPFIPQQHTLSPTNSVNENKNHQPVKPLDSVTNYHIWTSLASPTTTVSTTTTTPTPLVSDTVKRLPVSLTRPRSVNHNYAGGDNWTPTHYGGFKPLTIDAIAASSSLVPTAAVSSPANNYSDYFHSTKRVSGFWNKRPFATSITKFNETSDSIEDLLKFHPAKINADNKIALSISPASLLEQINKESGRRSIDCKNKDLGWCDHTDNYPTHFVLAVVKECRDVIDRMYVEVPQNLADFDDFVPFSPLPTNSTGQFGQERANQATWSWAGYRSKTKALCDAERKFVRPSVAQDITGRWFIIVQSSLYHQQVPVEMCRNPGGICNNIGECGTHARCVQKFHTQLLISIDLDKENDCPSMRLYRFPSGCVCDAAYYQ